MLMRAPILFVTLWLPLVVLCSSCAQLAALASGPSPSTVGVKSYSIFLDNSGETEIRFEAPVLTEQQIDEDGKDIVKYKAKSRDGVKIIIFAEKNADKTNHESCRAYHYARSPEAISKYVKAITTENITSDGYEAELSIYQPRINLGKNKHFASAHAYFLHGQRCYNFHVIKAHQSERDKKLVSSILRSIAYETVPEN